MRELVLKKLSEIILKNHYKDKANLKIYRFYQFSDAMCNCL